jgi:hypothetical protein
MRMREVRGVRPRDAAPLAIAISHRFPAGGRGGLPVESMWREMREDGEGRGCVRMRGRAG